MSFRTCAGHPSRRQGLKEWSMLSAGDTKRTGCNDGCGACLTAASGGEKLSNLATGCGKDDEPCVTLDICCHYTDQTPSLTQQPVRWLSKSHQTMATAVPTARNSNLIPLVGLTCQAMTRTSCERFTARGHMRLFLAVFPTLRWTKSSQVTINPEARIKTPSEPIEGGIYC